MQPSVYDLKLFYGTRLGRIARRTILNNLKTLWPNSASDLANMSLLGVGYPLPYLKTYLDSVERLFVMMQPGQGVRKWPEESRNLVCLAEEREWPVETNSIDRLFIIHALEYAESLRGYIEEAWRVLKGNGRLVIVVPNRSGLWARADWTPFGHGKPYSAGQINTYLKDNYFVHERTINTLFFPPFRNVTFLEAGRFLEYVGPYVMPALSGVYIIEATKQIYTGTPVKADRKVRFVRGFMPKPVPNPKTSLTAQYHPD